MSSRRFVLFEAQWLFSLVPAPWEIAFQHRRPCRPQSAEMPRVRGRVCDKASGRSLSLSRPEAREVWPARARSKRPGDQSRVSTRAGSANSSG
jgi:hypothetical protein